MISVEELFQAYFDCRQNKRNTLNALKFEVNYESNIIQLYNEIITQKYEVGPSIAFVVKKPTLREIFAADFRDRIVHHLVINKLNPLFEKKFIYDSYACRVGKGTHFGIERVNKFIRQCSDNYSKNAYILKLDIEGFFMHIDKSILFNRLQAFINEKLVVSSSAALRVNSTDPYTEPDKELLIELCKKVIFNNPVENCIIKGKKSNWNDLPATKSLFHSPVNCGLPIGNLTSQIFANFYLDSFDHYIKHDLQIKYYGRYVDDFVIVHPDKEYLKSLIPNIQDILLSTLKLNVHPRKIYLQSYEKGVQFLGTIIKPNRTYIARRTKGNLYKTIEQWNNFIKENNNKMSRENLKPFLSSINSYLGMMKHYETYKLRKKMLLKNLSAYVYNYVYISGGYCKLVPKIRIIKTK